MGRYLNNDEAVQAVKIRELDDGMTLVIQPPRSKICGQCAMAMITGVDVAEIVSQTELHPSGGTSISTRDKVLREHFEEVVTKWDVDNRKAIDLSGKGLLMLQYGRSMSGHALAFREGKIYDPAGRFYASLKELRECYKRRGYKIRVHAITWVN